MITPETRIMVIMKEYPELTDYFLELGYCGCGGLQEMKKTVKDVAEEKGFEIEAFIESLNSRLD